MYGTELAKFQDDLLFKYKHEIPITQDEIKKLNNNWWIKVAEIVAPNNLVLRNYMLSDLISGYMLNYDRVVRLIDKLSIYKDYQQDLLWAEGYSYWLYTKEVLMEYHSCFRVLMPVIKEIERNFSRCGYLRDGVIYPAPFGDVGDQPCVDQNTKCMDIVTIANVHKRGDNYFIEGQYKGLNMHTQDGNLDMCIVNGRPEGFNFYEGYDKKYKSKREEYLAMLLRSIKVLFFGV